MLTVSRQLTTKMNLIPTGGAIYIEINVKNLKLMLAFLMSKAISQCEDGDMSKAEMLQ